ncbi:hypothetical protein DWV32_06770 [Collinsella sp. AF04-24]|nr:hypothetical protein DWV32_06770 [Collinsella sp. AF04-24]
MHRWPGLGTSRRHRTRRGSWHLPRGLRRRRPWRQVRRRRQSSRIAYCRRQDRRRGRDARWWRRRAVRARCPWCAPSRATGPGAYRKRRRSARDRTYC